MIGCEGGTRRHLSAELLQEACEEALSEQVEAEPEADNDTQPEAPYA